MDDSFSKWECCAVPNCWICKLPLGQGEENGAEINCRTCGPYAITASQRASQFPLPDSERFRLSFWNKQRQLEGREMIIFATDTMKAVIAQLPNPSVNEKPDMLLVSLSRVHPNPGERFVSDPARDYSLASARDGTEYNFFQKSLIQGDYIDSTAGKLEITAKGWHRIAELTRQSGATSKTAFVAMKFNDEMLGLWAAAFQPAIVRAQFEPRIANDPAHNEQIDAHIIVELKRSRFVVADVTYASPGVYFEAGYALGMGRHVIWTCRSDHKDDMHFDTRQYNHILWADSADLEKQLYARIVATM
jgi:nucleoside 2-deoxyribosyltransferase